MLYSSYIKYIHFHWKSRIIIIVQWSATTNLKYYKNLKKFPENSYHNLTLRLLIIYCNTLFCGEAYYFRSERVILMKCGSLFPPYRSNLVFSFFLDACMFFEPVTIIPKHRQLDKLHSTSTYIISLSIHREQIKEEISNNVRLLNRIKV